jgi:hypothetical protein
MKLGQREKMNKDKLVKKKEKEKRTVEMMIRLYCTRHHGSKKGVLCEECGSLKAYALSRVEHCPNMATKTFCSKCQTHCYKPEMRERIREVMRYSGPRIITYSPLICIRHWIVSRSCHLD